MVLLYEKRRNRWSYKKTSDFFVREITNREEGEEGKYLIAELTKENWDTHSRRGGIRKIGRSTRENFKAMKII
jgi:tRNA(Glu) U13 pseudouridine synthase TruD